MKKNRYPRLGEVRCVHQARCGACEAEIFVGKEPNKSVSQTLRSNGWKKTSEYGWTCDECVSREYTTP